MKTFILTIVMSAGGLNPQMTNIEGFTSEQKCDKAGFRITKAISDNVKINAVSYGITGSKGSAEVNYSCVEITK